VPSGLLLAPGGPVRASTPQNRATDRRLDPARPNRHHVDTSVCTGATALGAAGCSTDCPTTHWSAYDALAYTAPNHTEQRVVTAGRMWTGAGVSAGHRLALTLAAKIAGPK